MIKPSAVVVRAPGTNREHDVAFALELAGAAPSIISMNELVDDTTLLDRAQILVIGGGFSYADSLGAGRMFALSLQHRLGDRVRRFVDAGHLVIGICNGFQTLVRAGLLPGALGHNDSGHFQCEWVTLQAQPSRCVWTADVGSIECPIAHGEGRYVHPDIAALERSGQIALRYSANPNGSMSAVAGVCDETGLVLGLMPHPENHVLRRQHPRHTRGDHGGLGLQLFERGVAHARSC